MHKVTDISIVIPAFNEELYIVKLLTQIRSQKYPQNKVETIVVDNNSTDKTLKVVKNFINDNPNMKIKLLLEQRGGVNFARNKGGYAAKGKILIFLDADNSIKNNFLQNIGTKLKNSSLSAGSFYTIPENNSWIDNILFNIIHLLKICGFKPHGKCFLKRNLFDKVGGWDEKVKIGTTVDFNSRLKKECQKQGLNYAVTNIRVKASLRRFKTQGYLSVLWIWLWAYFGLRNRWYDR